MRPAKAQARAAAGSTVPVLIVIFGIVVIWYLAAVYLNSPFQLGLYERDDKDWTAADLVRDTLAQERPVLPSPHQVAAELWKTSVGTPVTSKRSLVYHGWVTLSSTLLGFAIAYYYYVLHPELPPLMAANKGLLYTFFYNKWYFDELYDFLFVRPAFWLGRTFWKIGDGLIIDGLGPDGIAARVMDATRGAVRLQSGYVYHYAFAMLIGVVVLATYFLFAGGTP